MLIKWVLYIVYHCEVMSHLIFMFVT